MKLATSFIHSSVFRVFTYMQAGGHYYLQKQGICQGSVVSTLLCLFYYGVMERQYLPSVLEGEEILMRQVDDFLYVTPYIDRARTFAEILLKGAVQAAFQ